MEAIFEKIENLAFWEGFEILGLYWYENIVIFVYDKEQRIEPVSMPGFDCIGYPITEFANEIYQSNSFLFSLLEYGKCEVKLDFPYMNYFNETASLKEHLKKASHMFMSMKRSKAWDVNKAGELLWHVESLNWISMTHKPSPLSLMELVNIQMDDTIRDHMINISELTSKRMEKDAIMVDYVDMQLQAFRYRLQNMRIKRKDKNDLTQWVNAHLQGK